MRLLPYRISKLVVPPLAIFALVILAVSSSAQIVKIPHALFYTATSTGALRCNQGNLWFGRVTVGTSSTLSATLTNTGTANITVTAMSQNAAEFSVSGLNFRRRRW